MRTTRFIHSATLAAVLLWLPTALVAQQDRIIGKVDASRLVKLTGSVNPQATPASDVGAVDPSMKLNYVRLMLKPSAAQQADLNQFLHDQQTPGSPNFRKWLTPEQFADRFGVSQADIAQDYRLDAVAGIRHHHRRPRPAASSPSTPRRGRSKARSQPRFIISGSTANCILRTPPHLRSRRPSSRWYWALWVWMTLSRSRPRAQSRKAKLHQHLRLRRHAGGPRHHLRRGSHLSSRLYGRRANHRGHRAKQYSIPPISQVFKHSFVCLRMLLSCSWFPALRTRATSPAMKANRIWISNMRAGWLRTPRFCSFIPRA